MLAVRRRTLAIGAAALVAGGLVVWWYRLPPDTTPVGAYARIAANIGSGEPREVFAYLEEDAQHACFTILSYAKLAVARIERDYPEEARADALAPYAPIVAAGDGPEVWVLEAERRGYINRLRRDLSGAAEVEIAGDRATVTSARGTRYPFRRRPNGIWGLTIFTAELVAEAEKMARDWELIQRAAADYSRAQGKE
jgi:hypothetical protein